MRKIKINWVLTAMKKVLLHCGKTFFHGLEASAAPLEAADGGVVIVVPHDSSCSGQQCKVGSLCIPAIGTHKHGKVAGLVGPAHILIIEFQVFCSDGKRN